MTKSESFTRAPLQWNAIIISAIQIKVCEETETVKNNFLIISGKIFASLFVLKFERKLELMSCSKPGAEEEWRSRVWSFANICLVLQVHQEPGGGLG